MDYMKKWNRFISENKRKKKDKDSDNVVKAILTKDNKVLTLKGPRNWELPGGHMHVDEEKMAWILILQKKSLSTTKELFMLQHYQKVILN